MSLTNIHYELTKQRVSQSMRIKGAAAAYDRIRVFLDDIGQDVTIRDGSVSFYVWVETKAKIRAAKALEKSIRHDLGAPSGNTEIRHYFSFRRRYEKAYDWGFSLDDAHTYLSYVDELGPLLGLEPRPPVSVTFLAEFRLPGVDEHDAMKSKLIAWLSPVSNSVTLDLEFPFQRASHDFEDYRKIVQTHCPVPLEDKYFYIRRGAGPEHYSFRHLY